MKLTKGSFQLLGRIVAASYGDGSEGVWAYWLEKPITKKDRGNLSDLVQKGLIIADEFDGDAYYTITRSGFQEVTK